MGQATERECEKVSGSEKETSNIQSSLKKVMIQCFESGMHKKVARFQERMKIHNDIGIENILSNRQILSFWSWIINKLSIK